MKRAGSKIGIALEKRSALGSRLQLADIRRLWSQAERPSQPPRPWSSIADELEHYLQIASFRARLRMVILEHHLHELRDQPLRKTVGHDLNQLKTELRICEGIAFFLLNGRVPSPR
jgi:hypothetical protein